MLSVSCTKQTSKRPSGRVIERERVKVTVVSQLKTLHNSNMWTHWMKNRTTCNADMVMAGKIGSGGGGDGNNKVDI